MSPTDHLTTTKHQRKGRGASSNRVGRYESLEREDFDDGWDTIEEATQKLRTSLTIDASKSIIAHNQSPDIPFDASINPYKGCEHGCIYCFARPTHAWLGLSPGLDFETKLYYKPDGATLLRQELAKRGYRCSAITIGANTDPYQPIERQLETTRELLKVMQEAQHPFSIITKSALVERDLDILAPMAEQKLCNVFVSVTTLDRTLSRKMEPRAAAPQRRLRTIQTLRDAGVPVGALLAPIIPILNDSELESMLAAVHDAGAMSASYIIIRLPLELSELFQEWLHTHYPLKADHVMARIRDMRGGKDYDSRFGKRMRGEGPFARLIQKRFDMARQRLSFPGVPELDTSLFVPTVKPSNQLQLF